MGYRQGILTFATRPPFRIRVAIPGTLAEMQRGLQRFKQLATDEGMVFASRKWPNEEAIPMWMAGVKYPLSMTWISKDGVVTAIEDHVQPGDRNTFDHRGLACIEMNAGIPDAVGIKPGSRASLEID